MNVQNQRDNYPKLISYMETNGYSKTYVDRFKREIKKIISADSKEWACYNFLRGILKNLKLKLAMRLRAAGMLSKEK